MPRVLVVDDEDDIRSLVRALLERGGHEVIEANDGREGLRVFHAKRPELVILDISMPGLDGWQTLERIRELSDVPVVLLTARDQELDKVRGLQTGADDYVTKPFGPQELLARVERHLRRSRPEVYAEPAYEDALLTVDFAQRTVLADGEEVSLTPLEFRLLSAFVRNPNQVLSHDQLIELAWGAARGGGRDHLKLYVGYLRRKLGSRASEDSPIETVRGFGYRYNAPARERQPPSGDAG